jgi:hypothetical protein
MARLTQRSAQSSVGTEWSSPSAHSPRTFRIEGAALAASGALFLAKAFFDLGVGEPPAGGRKIVEWASAEKFSISMTNEILIIASVLLVPGLIGLYASLVGFDRRKTATGCGIVAVLIPVIVAIAIVHGRLVYPVYDIDLKDPSVIQLVASTYYGGEHAVVLLLGVATILLSLAMRNTPYGNPIVYLGLVTGVLDIIGSYPWLIGSALTFASELLLALWFIAVGGALAGSRWQQIATN